MDPDETRISPPPSTKGELPAAPSDAELSRIAREAVRQPADPRLDKQLARMGLTDDPVVSAPPTARATATDPALKALQGRVRLLETVVWLLVAAVVILTAALIVLLIR
jgi:hypothetical protein